MQSESGSPPAAEPEGSFIRDLVPKKPPTRGQILWTTRIIIVFALVLGVLTLIGLPFDITLWAWVKLLIVPAAIAAGGIWFSRQQRKRELEAEAAQQERELAVEKQRAQDEALQAYLDQMSTLLLEKDLSDDKVRTLLRARTLTALTRLDAGRKRSVLQFLYESGLVKKGHVVVDLRGADLTAADLRAANLGSVNLSETDLRGANLNAAGLSGADLSEANLSDANLSAVDLSEADLKGADLLRASLSAANLHGTDLSEADLLRASLSAANLIRVRGVTNKEIAQRAGSLAGATMPNGQKYEDWLKVKEDRGEDGGERGPS